MLLYIYNYDVIIKRLNFQTLNNKRVTLDIESVNKLVKNVIQVSLFMI